MKQGLVRLLYNFGKKFMGWTLHMIMCVLLCYPVSIHMSQLLSTGCPISSFECEILKCRKDKKGNLLNLILKLSMMILNIICVYGPNTDNTEFYKDVEDFLEDTNSDYTLICGDFNLVLNPDLDSCNYKHINNPRARQIVLNMMVDCDLCDLYRQFKPDQRCFTWRRKNPVKQARLDYFLASSNMLDIIKRP